MTGKLLTPILELGHLKFMYISVQLWGIKIMSDFLIEPSAIMNAGVRGQILYLANPSLKPYSNYSCVDRDMRY